jgi:hypothetical protein
MHTGLGDAVDLGWKLAAALQGWGGPVLLESYEIERRPVARRNVVVATDEYNILSQLPGGSEIDRDTEPGAAQRRRFADAFRAVNSGRSSGLNDNLRLNYGYEDSPVVVAEREAPPRLDGAAFVTLARAGTRAPHGWIAPGRSTLDLFGTTFVALRAGEVSVKPLEDAARRRGVPLEVFDLPSAELAALYGRALTLVRPDGHIAWRGDALPPDALSLVDHVRGATPISTSSPTEDAHHA